MGSARGRRGERGCSMVASRDNPCLAGSRPDAEVAPPCPLAHRSARRRARRAHGVRRLARRARAPSGNPALRAHFSRNLRCSRRARAPRLERKCGTSPRERPRRRTVERGRRARPLSGRRPASRALHRRRSAGHSRRAGAARARAGIRPSGRAPAVARRTAARRTEAVASRAALGPQPSHAASKARAHLAARLSRFIARAPSPTRRCPRRRARDFAPVLVSA